MYHLMKLPWLFLFTFFIVFKSKSQDCDNIDKEMVSLKLKTGSHFPSEFLTTCAKNKKLGSQYYLNYDNLDQNCKKKYVDLFKVFSLRFADLHVAMNRNGEIYFVEFENFFKNKQPKKSVNKKLPKEFKKFKKRFESLFGNEPMEEKINSTGNSIIGISRNILWSCNDLVINMSDNLNKYGETLQIWINNRKYEIVDVSPDVEIKQ